MTSLPRDSEAAARRRRQVLLAVGIAVAVVLVGAVWLASRAGTEPTAPPIAGASPTTASGSATDPSGSTEVPREPSVTPTAAPPSGEPAPQPTPVGTPEPEPFVEEVAPPVSLGEASETTDGVEARVVDLRAVQGDAEGPGEVAGPALRFDLVLGNGTDRTLDLDTVVVNLYVGPERLPANLLAGSGEGLFQGDLAPGEDAAAVYVFRVDPGLREVVALTLSYEPGRPALLFEGPAPVE